MFKNLTLSLLLGLSLTFVASLSYAQNESENLSDTLDQEPVTEGQQEVAPNNTPSTPSEANTENNGVTNTDPYKNEIPESTEPVQNENLGERIMEMNASNLNREYYKEFIYEERDRRDPFIPIAPIRQSVTSDPGAAGSVEGLQQFDVAQLVVSAIVWNSRQPKALVRDPLNNIYTVKEKDLIGRNNGYIESIREGEIVVIESREIKGGERFYTTQVLRVGR